MPLLSEAELVIARAPLYLSATSASSRAVAAQAGVSQATVSRLWGRIYKSAPPPSLAAWLRSAGSERLRLQAVAVSRLQSVLVFEREPDAGDASPLSAAMHSRLRPYVQTVLAADLAAAAQPQRGGDDGATGDVAVLANGIAGPRLLCVFKGIRPEVGEESGADVAYVELRTELEWQQQLLEIVRRSAPGGEARWADAQVAVRRWVRSQDDRILHWRWVPTDVARGGAKGTLRQPSLARTLADSAAALLERELHEDRSDAGRRFSESFVAVRLRTSRQQARDALRLLADDGLVRLDVRGSASVPAPDTSDVLETYAIRKALGTIAVNRLASASPVPRAALEAALNRLDSELRHGDSWTAGLADLEFQDRLVSLAEIARTEVMFRRLTTQLRLFVSALGLRYQFSAEQISDDNAALVEAVLRSDRHAAVVSWHEKVNGAVTYMLGSLPTSRSFDFGPTATAARERKA